MTTSPTSFDVFHIHVYYSAQTRAEALRLRQAAIEQLHLPVSPLVDRAVGPHPQPMLQINFRLPQFATVIEFLLNHRGPLDILIHPDTGNDVVDHTQHAIWLGTPVALDIHFLRTL
jgi:aromatic ring-cleaving dioxygenase